MQLWLINHYAGLPATVPATRPYDLARQLVRLGHAVTIFACSFNHYTFAEEQLAPGQWFKIDENEGVRFVWIRGASYRRNGWRRLLNMLAFSLLAFIIGWWLSPKPDLIIGTTVHPFAPISAYALSRFRRARFWLDITDIWPQSLIDLGHLQPGSLVARCFDLLESFSLRRAQVVMSVLPGIAEYARDKRLPGKQTVWTPNGIDRQRWNAAGHLPEPEPGCFKVMYAGGFAPAHALDVILQAAEVIQAQGSRDIRFVLVGDGLEMGNIKTFIAQHKLDNVELAGFVPKQDLYPLLAKASAFVVTARNLPVYRYGISFNKISDYLLVGRPVILALNSANNPIADAGAGLSVPGQDPQALAQAVLALYEMPPEARREMGERGRQFALREFDYAATAQRMARLFQEYVPNRQTSL